MIRTIKNNHIIRALAFMLTVFLLLPTGPNVNKVLAAGKEDVSKEQETTAAANKTENSAVETGKQAEAANDKNASGKKEKTQEELWQEFCKKLEGQYLLEKDHKEEKAEKAEKADKEAASLSFFSAFGNLFLDEMDLILGEKNKKPEVYAYRAGEVYPVTVEEDAAIVRIWWFSDMSLSGHYWPESGASYTIYLDEDGILIEGEEDISFDGVALLDKEAPVSFQYGPDSEAVLEKAKKTSPLPKELAGVWEYHYGEMEYRLSFEANGAFSFLRKAEESPAEYYEGTALIKDDTITLIGAKLGSGQKPYEAEFILKWEDSAKKTEYSLKNPSGKTGSIPVYNKKKGTYSGCDQEQEILLMLPPTAVGDEENLSGAENETKSADGKENGSKEETKSADGKENGSKEETKAAEGKNGGSGKEEETKPSEGSSGSKENTDTGKDSVVYTKADVKALKNTKHFLSSALTHIFLGEINKSGVGTGYHYDGIVDSPGKIIKGTKTAPDERGVYTGKVEVDGVKKTGNRGYSTFYPETMSPQDVVDAINEAYENRELISGNLYAGLTKDGMEIDMALTDDGKIITAYPIKEE